MSQPLVDSLELKATVEAAIAESLVVDYHPTHNTHPGNDALAYYHDLDVVKVIDPSEDLRKALGHLSVRTFADLLAIDPDRVKKARGMKCHGSFNELTRKLKQLGLRLGQTIKRRQHPPQETDNCHCTETSQTSAESEAGRSK